MQFKKTTLKNGLRVITVPMADNPSVTILVVVEAGSEYETKELNGISHFLEHMVFKGTTKRPKAIDISRELDGIGAIYNAFTSAEFTGYYAKADSKRVDDILDVVSDMYLDPLFDEAEMEREKGVIVEEIRMYRDLPQRHVQDVFTALLYGEQPAGRHVVGTEANVRSFSREALVKYRKERYVSYTTTVMVAGSFDEAEMIKKIERTFCSISPEKAENKSQVTESQKSPAISIEFKETDQTHLVIGVRTFPVTDRRMPAMSVLSTLLGHGMSSRLFSKMRDELGICYYIKADDDPSTDHGSFSISAGVDNSRIEEGIRGILAECDRLKKELVSESELKKVKDYIAGTTILGLETSEARAEFFGLQEVLKKDIESLDELIAKINSVTAEDVRDLARSIFVNENLNMALIGRVKDDSIFKVYFRFSD